LTTTLTERKELQARAAQADRLASMGLLAAGVAHEVNNPLAYVLYNLESLTEDLPRITDSMRRCISLMVNRIGAAEWERVAGSDAIFINPATLHDISSRFKDALQGIYRIRDVARGLGTFSRVEDDRNDPVNLMHVIEVAIQLVFNEIRFRCRLVKEYGAIASVMGSDGALSQVFLNLLLNAAHSIEEGDVEGNEIRIKTWQEDGEVCAEVRDTGSGIESEKLQQVFQPFFTTKEQGAGTGLGLYISKSIIEGHGGAISVDSTPGKGTVFVIRLPVSPEEGQVLPQTSSEAGGESVLRGRILVVDDDRPVRSMIARLLREHEVVLAASGVEAREILEGDQNFDVVLCDLMMPEVSGMDLHRWVLEAYGALDKRFIFMTGGAFTPQSREYLSRVDNQRLEKPFNVTNFKHAIRDRITIARQS